MFAGGSHVESSAGRQLKFMNDGRYYGEAPSVR
jgi:hypothetical protein